ncbi:MAG: hypothetical protein II676_05940 [Bacteroidales bacterium]|nr:hypothetical protein [Bacteroidales bacterium]
MKKIYQKPAMQAVAIRQKCAILTGSEVNSVGGNAGFNSKVSAGSGTARSRSFDDWDDEE